MNEEEKKKTLARLLLIDKILKQRESIGDPVAYGLPNLLRPQQPDEDEEDFNERRKRELVNFIEDELYLVKDGVKQKIKLIDPMTKLIYDCFYKITNRAILWKPRGSGGSVSVSIIIFLMMVYYKMSFTLVAGSQDQSKVVYSYVLQLWSCNSNLAAGMLAQDPTQTKIQIKAEAGGNHLECVTASEKAVRGKHTAGLVIDEAAQRDAHTDQALEAATQGPLSEKEYLIILCSTFHTTSGLYQSFWDYSDEKGYTRYRWSIFDAMAPCKERIDCRKCELTRPMPKFSKQGKLLEVRFEGCAGTARTSKGWQKFSNVLEAKRQNEGTAVFLTEWECLVPETPIITNNGYSQIKDIRVGDFVLTDDGKYNKVTDVMSRNYFGKLLEIRTLGSYDKVYITPNHEILTKKRAIKSTWKGKNKYKTVSDYAYIPADSIEVGDLLLAPSVKDRAIKEYSIKYNNTDIKLNEDFCWGLGLLFGDGHCDGKSVVYLTWNIHESDIRIKYENWVKTFFNKDVAENVQVRSPEAIGLRFFTKEFSSWFRDNFYDDFDKTIPSFMFELSDKCILSFLKGWHDADGCDSHSGSSRISTSIYQNMLKGKELCRLINIRANTYSYKQLDGSFSNSDNQWILNVHWNKPFRNEVMVRDIKEIDYNGLVYNISIENNPTYNTSNFAVHNCQRGYGGSTTVYNPLDLIEADKICPKDYNGDSYVPFDSDCELSIGIDWGKVQTAIVLLVKTEEYIGILEARAFTGANLHEVTRYLQGLHRKYRPGALVLGKNEMGSGVSSKNDSLIFVNLNDVKTKNLPITIWGDSSHPFNNKELKQLGYIVEEVMFNQWKDFGVENISKYLYTNRLWIPKNRPDGDFALLTKQMKLYTRDDKGKPVKKNDHFNDALMCAALAFPYISEFAHKDMVSGMIPTGDVESEVKII